MTDPVSRDVSNELGTANDVWEDLPSQTISGQAPHWGTSVRRKRRQTMHFHAWPSSSRRIPPKFRTRVPTLERSPSVIPEPCRDAFTYTLEIIHGSMLLLRYPFSALLSLWILYFLLSKGVTAIRVPFCQIPVLSHMVSCALDQVDIPLWADYPRLVEVQSSSFEQLLDESVGSSELSLEIKKAEMVTSDLVTLVRFSDLKGREVIANMLQDFVSDAKLTGRSLHKLSSRIGGAVDRYLSQSSSICFGCSPSPQHSCSQRSCSSYHRISPHKITLQFEHCEVVLRERTLRSRHKYIQQCDERSRNTVRTYHHRSRNLTG